MKISITGYNVSKSGEFILIHGIDMTPLKNGAGFKPYYSVNKGQFQEGIWISTSIVKPSKDIINKVLNVEYNQNGRPVNVKLEG